MGKYKCTEDLIKIELKPCGPGYDKTNKLSIDINSGKSITILGLVNNNFISEKYKRVENDERVVYSVPRKEITVDPYKDREKIFSYFADMQFYYTGHNFTDQVIILLKH